MSYSESPIDERYRLSLLEYYLDGAVDAPYRGYKKWMFICPFCGSMSSKEYKKKEKKASMLWDSRQNSWIFFCARKKSVQCMNSMNFGNFISEVGAFYWTALAPEIVNSGREEQGSVSV